MTEHGPRPLPVECCAGAVVLTSAGMALHSWGMTCAECGRFRRLLRMDTTRPTAGHVCSDCDPAHKAYREQARRERETARRRGR